VGDRVYMLETLGILYSPESCSSFMESWEYKEIAAEALKLTSDMKSKN
jgi:acetyl-CoA carboxylase carboxyl transferase subunit alpha